MTQFTTSKGEFIAVPVPNDAKYFVLNQDNKHSGIEYTSMGIFKVQTWLKDNPGVDFEIIGLYSDMLDDYDLFLTMVEDEEEAEELRYILKDYKINGSQLIIKTK